jgi:sulfite reductase (NADPH) flavoprotein alpha-component
MSPANPAAALSTLPQPPLSVEPYSQIARLVEGLDSAGLWWLSGYTAGLARAQGAAAPLAPFGANADNMPERTRLTVVYGSQTGNARRVAEALAAKLETDGLPVPTRPAN